MQLSDHYVPVTHGHQEFREQIEQFTKRVFQQVRVKTMYGHAVTGPALLRLAQEYTRAINEGAAPVIATAWNATVQLAARDASTELQLTEK